MNNLEENIKLTKFEQKKAQKKIVILILFLIIFSCLGIFCLYLIDKFLKNDPNYVFYFFGSFLCLFLILWNTFCWTYIDITHNYKTFYKNHFIKELVSFINNDFIYSSYKAPFCIDFNAIGPYSNMFREDFIGGKYKGINFVMCELIKKKEDLYLKSDILKTILIAKKLFDLALNIPETAEVLICDFYKNINCDIAIVSKEFGKPLGSKVEILDNINFNKEFNVFSDDEIMARYFLVPNLMEKLYELKKSGKYGLVNAGIIKNQFFLFLGTNKNKFETSLLFDTPTIELAEHYKAEILEILSVIDELNLTLNIYPKTVLKNQKFTR